VTKSREALAIKQIDQAIQKAKAKLDTQVILAQGKPLKR
jgi:hypothetical protein